MADPRVLARSQPAEGPKVANALKKLCFRLATHQPMNGWLSVFARHHATRKPGISNNEYARLQNTCCPQSSFYCFSRQVSFWIWNKEKNVGGAHVVFAMLERWAISFYKAWWGPMEEKWQGKGKAERTVACNVRFEEIGTGWTVGYSFPHIALAPGIEGPWHHWGCTQFGQVCQWIWKGQHLTGTALESLCFLMACNGMLGEQLVWPGALLHSGVLPSLCHTLGKAPSTRLFKSKKTIVHSTPWLHVPCIQPWVYWVQGWSSFCSSKASDKRSACWLNLMPATLPFPPIFFAHLALPFFHPLPCIKDFFVTGQVQGSLCQEPGRYSATFFFMCFSKGTASEHIFALQADSAPWILLVSKGVFLSWAILPIVQCSFKLFSFCLRSTPWQGLPHSEVNMCSRISLKHWPMLVSDALTSLDLLIIRVIQASSLLRVDWPNSLKEKYTAQVFLLVLESWFPGRTSSE